MGGFRSSFLQIFFLLLSLLSFWFSHNAHVGELDGLPQIPWAVCTSFFFLLLRLDYCSFYIQIYLFFLLLPQICWTPLMYFFHVIVLFQLQNFYMVPFYKFSIDILILFIYYFPGFLYCLSIPEAVGLKSLSCKCDVSASSGMDSVIFFFLWMSYTSQFLCMHGDFIVPNWTFKLFLNNFENQNLSLPQDFLSFWTVFSQYFNRDLCECQKLKKQTKIPVPVFYGLAVCLDTLYHLARPFMILTQPSLSECTKPRPTGLSRSFLSIIPILAF